MDITHLISHNSNSLNKQKPPSPLPISPRNESLTYAHNQKRQSLSHNMMTPSQSQVHRVQEHHLPPFLSPPLSHASQSMLQTPISTSMNLSQQPPMMHTSQQTQNSIDMQQQPLQSQTTQLHQQPQQQQQQQQQSHTPPNRRIAHILSEQKRRENINSGFEELKSIVPSCRGCADSKAIILRKAAHYIQALEAQIQKLKQSSSGSTTPNTSSVTTPPLVSPVMSVKPISSSHIHMHGGINGNQMYAITDFNQRVGEEKKIQQQLEQQKFMGQWQTNRLNPNYLPDTSTTTTTSSSYQPSHQSQNNHHTQTHHQRNLSYPIPRHHPQYHYSHNNEQQLKTENMDWIPGGDKNHHHNNNNHHFNNNHNYETKMHHHHQSYHRNYHPYHSDMNSSPSRSSPPHSMGRVMLKHEIHDQTYK